MKNDRETYYFKKLVTLRLSINLSGRAEDSVLHNFHEELKLCGSL